MVAALRGEIRTLNRISGTDAKLCHALTAAGTGCLSYVPITAQAQSSDTTECHL
jgi:hypothetical protein